MNFPCNTRLTIRQADALLAMYRAARAAGVADARLAAATRFFRAAHDAGLTVQEARDFAHRHTGVVIEGGEP